MGGEHEKPHACASLGAGSSPHGRGTLSGVRFVIVFCRVIPAWAGNIIASRAFGLTSSGHPRMGGEHDRDRAPAARSDGSSPHGRGTCRNRRGYGPVRRVIPAWAGNIDSRSCCGGIRSGHPRMGGEHAGPTARQWNPCGSSPHGRGTLGLHHWDAEKGRVIPAWAGNMSLFKARSNASAGHPRMGGEHSVWSPCALHAIGSSPHGRGTCDQGELLVVAGRVIPAWAGNIGPRFQASRPAAGHPRMGGEHDHVMDARQVADGSSPHGRGT